MLVIREPHSLILDQKKEEVAVSTPPRNWKLSANQEFLANILSQTLSVSEFAALGKLRSANTSRPTYADIRAHVALLPS
jgi:hypothetical protein